MKSKMRKRYQKQTLLPEIGEEGQRKLLGPHEETEKTGIISFTVSKNGKLMDCHTAGMMLAQTGVILRAGSHCAYPLIDRLGVPGTVRISFSLYNDADDIQRFISRLKEIIPLLL
jgi:cysteine desulfurase/selenocysteine lyase